MSENTRKADLQNVADLFTATGATVTHIAGVPQPWTEEEAPMVLMQQAHRIIRSWLRHENMSTQERLEGVIFSFLAVLDGSSTPMVAFDLVPQVDEEYARDWAHQGQRYFKPGTKISAELHSLFYQDRAKQEDLIEPFDGWFKSCLSPAYTADQVAALNADHSKTEKLASHFPDQAAQYWEEKVIRQEEENTQAFQAHEMEAMLGEKIRRIVDQWLAIPHQGTEARLRGAVHEILRLLDGEDVLFPGFILRPVNRSGEAEQLMQKGYRYFDPGTPVFGKLAESFKFGAKAETVELTNELEKPWRDMMPGLPPAPPPVLPLDFTAFEHKYAAVGNELVNTVTGEPIPKDEPVFVIRAKDAHAISAMMHYSARCTDVNQRHDMAELMGQFVKWRMAHMEKVKEPDTK